jgi:hypothetical protein
MDTIDRTDLHNNPEALAAELLATMAQLHRVHKLYEAAVKAEAVALHNYKLEEAKAFLTFQEGTQKEREHSAFQAVEGLFREHLLAKAKASVMKERMITLRGDQVVFQSLLSMLKTEMNMTRPMQRYGT